MGAGSGERGYSVKLDCAHTEIHPSSPAWAVLSGTGQAGPYFALVTRIGTRCAIRLRQAEEPHCSNCSVGRNCSLPKSALGNEEQTDRFLPLCLFCLVFLLLFFLHEKEEMGQNENNASIKRMIVSAWMSIFFILTGWCLHQSVFAMPCYQQPGSSWLAGKKAAA